MSAPGAHAEERHDARESLAPVPATRRSDAARADLPLEALVEVGEQRVAYIRRRQRAQQSAKDGQMPAHRRLAMACSRRTYSRPAAVSL